MSLQFHTRTRQLLPRVTGSLSLACAAWACLALWPGQANGITDFETGMDGWEVGSYAEPGIGYWGLTGPEQTFYGQSLWCAMQRQIQHELH